MNTSVLKIHFIPINTPEKRQIPTEIGILHNSLKKAIIASKSRNREIEGSIFGLCLAEGYAVIKCNITKGRDVSLEGFMIPNGDDLRTAWYTSAWTLPYLCENWPNVIKGQHSQAIILSPEIISNSLDNIATDRRDTLANIGKKLLASAYPISFAMGCPPKYLPFDFNSDQVFCGESANESDMIVLNDQDVSAEQREINRKYDKNIREARLIRLKGSEYKKIKLEYMLETVDDRDEKRAIKKQINDEIDDRQIYWCIKVLTSKGTFIFDVAEHYTDMLEQSCIDYNSLYSQLNNTLYKRVPRELGIATGFDNNVEYPKTAVNSKSMQEITPPSPKVPESNYTTAPSSQKRPLFDNKEDKIKQRAKDIMIRAKHMEDHPRAIDIEKQAHLIIEDAQEIIEIHKFNEQNTDSKIPTAETAPSPYAERIIPKGKYKQQQNNDVQTVTVLNDDKKVSTSPLIPDSNADEPSANISKKSDIVEKKKTYGNGMSLTNDSNDKSGSEKKDLLDGFKNIFKKW